jgi:hypothetical protein
MHQENATVCLLVYHLGKRLFRERSGFDHVSRRERRNVRRDVILSTIRKENETVIQAPGFRGDEFSPTDQSSGAGSEREQIPV